MEVRLRLRLPLQQRLHAGHIVSKRFLRHKYLRLLKMHGQLVHAPVKVRHFARFVEQPPCRPNVSVAAQAKLGFRELSVRVLTR